MDSCPGQVRDSEWPKECPARTAVSTARAAVTHPLCPSTAAASRAADAAPIARCSGRRSAACCGVLGFAAGTYRWLAGVPRPGITTPASRARVC